MFHRLTFSLFVSLLLVAPTASGSTASQDSAPVNSRQVILIIGDGMDDQQISIARNYLAGAQGRLLLDELPLRSSSQVLTVEDKVDGKPIYVSDSANSATSMATGIVTSRGRISTTAGSDEDVTTIVEMASAAGFKTGIVTTASVTDATPAAFATHISYRMCEDPKLMEEISYYGVDLGECKVDLKSNGGAGSIAVQLADSSLDVILGGGGAHFGVNTYESDSTVLQLAQSNGFNTITSAGELSKTDPNQRLLGLFAEGTLPVRLMGEDGRKAEKPSLSMLNRFSKYLGSVDIAGPMTCVPNPKFSEVPSLKQMTDTALSHLAHNNSRGFFLMIESASIDKQAHERKACGSIGEVEQLNEALHSALAFAKDHPDTLILVTADHAQAAQMVPDVSFFADFPMPIYSPGYVARITTLEGATIAVNYATSNFEMEEHTGASVPLYGNEQSLGLVPSFIQQRDLFNITKRYLGL